jgi:hypothetical protein
MRTSGSSSSSSSFETAPSVEMHPTYKPNAAEASCCQSEKGCLKLNMDTFTHKNNSNSLVLPQACQVILICPTFSAEVGVNAPGSKTNITITHQSNKITVTHLCCRRLARSSSSAPSSPFR